MAKLIIELYMADGGWCGTIECPADERLNGTVVQWGGAYWSAAGLCGRGITAQDESVTGAIRKRAARFGYTDVDVKISA